MTATNLPTTIPPAPPVHRRLVLNNRPQYVAFGLAWLVGYGLFAVTSGRSPIVSLPGLAPAALIGGLVAAIVVTSVVAGRDQRRASPTEVLTGKLLTASWLVGFVALFLLITGVASATGDAHLQSLLWPTGSGLVVGLVYLAGGAAHRDMLQYALGTWLALISSASVFFDAPGMYWVLAVAGGGAYLAAAALEPRRRTAALAELPEA
ncbi:hypothetical protein Kfla_4466 [Kribbella flavida DSM 17836]|uniref:Uncharacterized protein n=1 Tax=Kribbella flavida (strain DSM 17836 / JCM 10339 / NBRC 14399) TaxID=479435 RepID=D2PWM7_KRIFD|nr:hypothetical protein [Kribbella flavida]ADB33496.1 hypothetical protein Kfla_4466 [Kribbella flavida DSM 17836]